MSRRLKITLAVIVAASLLTASLGGVVAAAGPVDASGSCPNFDVRQELQLTGFCGGGQGAGFYGEGVTEAVCQLLGLTTEELQTLRLEGKSLVEIAATSGVTEGALVEAIMEVKRAFIQEQVEAGIITQELADLMLPNMLEMTYQAVNRTSVGPVGSMAGGAGKGWGEPSDCTGPGDMHQWGKNTR